MAFESVTEQEGVVRRLRAMLQGGRLPHAFLFVGSVGTGRLAAARELAHVLLCSARKRPDEYCGKCADCRLFAAGSHPDYSDTGVPEGKQLVPIESVRGMERSAALKPVRAGRRVFVMRDAERISLEAANSFLKTLEEPPGGCVFILIASSLRRMPETVVSRCRIVRFANMPPDALADRLEADGLVAEDAQWLARRAWGSPGLARQFREAGLHEFNREMVEKLTKLAEAGAFALSDWFLQEAQERSSSGADARIALQELLECAAAYYRDLALAAGGPAAGPDAVLDRADLVLETIERIGANAQGRLALDRMFVRLARVPEVPA